MNTDDLIQLFFPYKYPLYPTYSSNKVSIYKISNNLLLSLQIPIDYALIKLFDKNGNLLDIPNDFKIYNVGKNKYINPIKNQYIFTLLFNDYIIYYNNLSILKLHNNYITIYENYLR